MDPAANIADDRDETASRGGGSCAMVERAVAFLLGGQRYALPIDAVREIQQIVAFSEVPSGGTGVVGMVNLRGNVIPAVDMRRLLGMEPRPYTLETPMVIAEYRGEVLALLVDEVEDVYELPADCLQAAPALHQLATSMIGVARLDDGLLYVLDIERVVGEDMAGEAR